MRACRRASDAGSCPLPGSDPARASCAGDRRPSGTGTGRQAKRRSGRRTVRPGPSACRATAPAIPRGSLCPRRAPAARAPAPGRRPRFARLRIREVDVVVGRVVRRQEHAQHAALSLVQDAGTLSTGVFSPAGHEPDGADFLGDEHASIGQERNAPGQLERRHLGHRERQARFRLQLARVDLGPAVADTSVSSSAAFRSVFMNLLIMTNKNTTPQLVVATRPARRSPIGREEVRKRTAPVLRHGRRARPRLPSAR